MGEERLTDKVAKIYELAKVLGTTRNDKERGSFFDNLTGLNFWYTTDFSNGDLSVRIHEWRNMLAAWPYLNDIVIKYKDKIVYNANVNRDCISIQMVNALSIGPEWISAVDRLIEEYAIPCRT